MTSCHISHTSFARSGLNNKFLFAVCCMDEPKCLSRDSTSTIAHVKVCVGGGRVALLLIHLVHLENDSLTFALEKREGNISRLKLRSSPS